MVKTPSSSHCKFIVLTNKSLLPHERFIRCSSLDDKIIDSIIASGTGVDADIDFDELICGLLSELPLRHWQFLLLACLAKEISDTHAKKRKNTYELVDMRTIYFHGKLDDVLHAEAHSGLYQNIRDTY